MKKSSTWRKTRGILTVMKVGVQIAGMGIIFAADKALIKLGKEKEGGKWK